VCVDRAKKVHLSSVPQSLLSVVNVVLVTYYLYTCKTRSGLGDGFDRFVKHNLLAGDTASFTHPVQRIFNCYNTNEQVCLYSYERYKIQIVYCVII